MNFQAETVAGCNLSCIECPVRMIQRPGDSRYIFMSPEIWDTIIRRYVVPYKDINNHIGPPTLVPHKDGEPLLNKQLPEMLKSASRLVPDVKIDIYTHGLLLPKKPDFLPFLGSLPNMVRVLVSFHFNNHDGTTNDYAAADAYLRKWLSRPKHGPENIEFVFASHLVPPMTRERLDEWKSGWKSFEDSGLVTVHANTLINPWTGLMEDVATCRFNGCPYDNFGSMFFGATGNVIACCMDLEEEIVFGNVMTDDPEDMVNTVREFYAAQKRREWKHQVCANCFGEKRTDLLQLGVA